MSLNLIAKENKLKIAVVEFEVYGENIDVKDISKVVPEMLIAELDKIKKYDIEERLLLSKVLEEQKLNLSGFISSEVTNKVGQLYGVDAIVTGSIMKVSEEIYINARIVSVVKGEIISSGKVMLKNISQLSNQIEILANLLCGITKEQLREQKEIQQKKRTKEGIEYGIFFNDDIERSWTKISPLYLGYSHYSKLFDINGGGIIPLDGIKEGLGGVFLNFVFNINYYFGLGLGWINLEYKSESMNFDIHYNQAGILIKFRPLNFLNLRFLFSAVIRGEIEENKKKYSVTSGFRFPPHSGFCSTLEFRISDDFSAGLKYNFLAQESDIKPEEIRSQLFSTGLFVNYGFTFANK